MIHTSASLLIRDMISRFEINVCDDLLEKEIIIIIQSVRYEQKERIIQQTRISTHNNISR
jgi:hypothetical protein